MDPTVMVMVIDPLQRQARYIIILRYTRISTDYFYQDADKDINASPCNPAVLMSILVSYTTPG